MMLNFIIDFYELVFNGFKFKLQGDDLKIFLPVEVSNKYKIYAKKFITNNKTSIIALLNNNRNNHNSIFHLVLEDHAFCLSFSQDRLWFIEKYLEGTNAYNIPIVFNIHSSTKLDILELSISSIVDRHEILRTLIKEDDESKVYQSVQNLQEYPFNIKKVIAIDQAQFEKTLEEQVNHIYDLHLEYPIRVCFYEVPNAHQKAQKQYYLSIVVHHIAFDGWSLDILMRELETYYNYYLNQLKISEPTLALPDLTIQYKDFALWQRCYLQGDRLEKLLCFWKNKLSGYEILNLVSDQQRPSQIDYYGKNIYCLLYTSPSPRDRQKSRMPSSA